MKQRRLAFLRLCLHGTVNRRGNAQLEKNSLAPTSMEDYDYNGPGRLGHLCSERIDPSISSTTFECRARIIPNHEGSTRSFLPTQSLSPLVLTSLPVSL